VSLFDDSDLVVCPKCRGMGTVYDAKIDADRLCDCRVARLPPPDTNPAGPAGIESRDDEVRLNKQQAAVWAVMEDEGWHTLSEVAQRTGYPEASISARFRDLRKQKYGSHTIERESLGGGLFRYRLRVNGA
jgi:hypothetical protein